MTERTRRVLPNRTLNDIQQQIKSLVNENVIISKRVRGQIKTIEGKITAVYANLFMLEREENGMTIKKTYTFSDILAEGIYLEKKKED